MIEFRVTPHRVRMCDVVEIVLDGKVCATMYPTATGIRVVSAHIKRHELKTGHGDMIPIPSVELDLDFEPQRYRVVGDRLVKYGVIDGDKGRTTT